MGEQNLCGRPQETLNPWDYCFGTAVIISSFRCNNFNTNLKFHTDTMCEENEGIEGSQWSAKSSMCLITNVRKWCVLRLLPAFHRRRLPGSRNQLWSQENNIEAWQGRRIWCYAKSFSLLLSYSFGIKVLALLL